MGFAADLRAFKAKTMSRLDAVVRYAALEVGDRLIIRTAVRTGKLVSNWNFSIGTPDLSVKEETSIRTLNGFDVVGRLAGANCYISNGVHYGVYLERGTERMAPQPMVEPTLIEWPQIVAAAAERAKAAAP